MREPGQAPAIEAAAEEVRAANRVLNRELGRARLAGVVPTDATIDKVRRGAEDKQSTVDAIRPILPLIDARDAARAKYAALVNGQEVVT